MESKENVIHNYIPEPNWANVRSIYKKLSDEFNVLTDSYHIVLSNTTKRQLDHLIIIIDDVDHCIDEIPDKHTRDTITTSLVDYLGNNENHWSHPKANKSLEKQIAIIKTIVIRENIQSIFIDAAKKIFTATELKRHTLSTNELIELIKLEGQATALLPLSFLGIKVTDPFGIFFTRLCMIMGIADLVFDARSDYKMNYIKIKPTIMLYIKLNYIVLIEGIKLIASFPKKFRFLVYCFTFTMALIKE